MHSAKIGVWFIQWIKYMRRSIKIRYIDFWDTFDKENFIVTKALSENNIVEIVNDNSADYVIYGTFGEQHWDVPDNCVKIFYTGENICPDFNACDYAIGFEHIDFGDRYLRLPNYYCTPHFLKSTKIMETGIYRNKSEEELFNRKFCSIVVSQSSGNPARLNIFEKLSTYKTVDSGGRWNNNVGGAVVDKLSFQSQYKFCISGENASHSGYTTEKIIEAYASGCVPIYWGDPSVSEVFNPKSFINATEFNSYDDLLSVVEKIDKDPSLYIAMIKEPIFLHPERDSIEAKYIEIVDFLDRIVNQPLVDARRRCRDEWGTKYINQRRFLLKKSNMSIIDFINDYLSSKCSRKL